MKEATDRLIRTKPAVLFILILCIMTGACRQKAEEPEPQPQSQPSPPEPNIVLIVIDTLRADHLPFYGYHKNTAPFMSGLASSGIVFDNVYATSSWTAPSTASIFTSLYPLQHGVVHGLIASRKLKKKNPMIAMNRIPEDIETIAEVCKRAGYKTFAVSGNANISKKMGFAQGFDRFRFKSRGKAHHINNLLKKWEEEIRSSGKYFVYLHYMDPHYPYMKNAPWYREADNQEDDLISAYDSEINYVDKYIGELFEHFGWDTNTLFIMTADHGEELFDRGGRGHGKHLYEETIRVPLLIYPPALVGEQTVHVSQNVSIIDILPTMRHILGVPMEPRDEGISLLPVARIDGENAAQRYLMSHLLRREEEFQLGNLLARSVVLDKDKYMVSSRDGEMYYDLENDPLEKTNAINENLDSARLLKDRLEHFEKTCRKYTHANVDIELDNELIEELKSLGYVQ